MTNSLQVETSAIGTTIAVAPDHPSIQPTVLLHAVQQLAALRRSAVAIKTALDERLEAFRDENQALVTEYENTKTAIAEAELTLRLRTVQRFNATDDRDPAPGLGIRVEHKPVYDVEVAFSWAKQTGACLKLDHDAMDAVVKSSPGVLHGARVVPTPVATIAKDLDKALAVASATAPAGAAA